MRRAVVFAAAAWAVVAAWSVPATAAGVAEMNAAADRVVAGALGEEAEQALFGSLAEASVGVADQYDQWVRTGADEHRRAGVAAGGAILPILEKLRAYHQGRLDKAQADIIREDGNPERLYTEKWWQLDRGFSLASAGQLAWLHYRMAMMATPGAAAAGQKEKRKAWLEKSVREFSEFVAAPDEKMRLESLLGRGMAERELGDREAAEADLQLVLQQARGTSLQWPARMALAEARASAGGAAALAETQKLMAEAQGAGVGADLMKQVRLLRFDALLAALAAGNAGDAVRSEAAGLAAQLSSLGPAFAQRVTQMTLARLPDPRPVLGATVSAEWIAAENLAAAEKFDEAARAYEKIARSADADARAHADEVHHRLGVCYFRLGRYADAERELRAYLAAVPSGSLAAESGYLQLRAAEGVFRGAPSPETRSSYLAVAEAFVRAFPDHESAYEGWFRYGELLQGDRRYREAADAYARVEGPPAFRLRAAASGLQCLADTLATAEEMTPADASALRARAEAEWEKFDKLASAQQATADLRARCVVARAMAAGSGPGADAARAWSMLADFEARFPAQHDLLLAVRALRIATATILGRLDDAETATRQLAAMPGVEANYFDLIGRLSRALLRRAADVAPDDPAASARWAAAATILFDRLRAAGRPIPDEVKLNLAQSYVEQGRLADASAVYGELLARTPDSRSLLRAAALLADRRGDAAASAPLWARLAQGQEVATPAWYEARLALAAALAAAGQGPKACASLREVEAFRPDLRDAATKARFAEMAAGACRGVPE